MTAAATRAIAKIARAAADGHAARWPEWIARIEAAGLETLVMAGALRREEAFWLAAWCFANDHDGLGLVAYERTLALSLEAASEKPNAPNYFRTLAYGMTAVRRGEAARALRALAPVFDVFAARATDVILLVLGRRDAPDHARLGEAREGDEEARRAAARRPVSARGRARVDRRADGRPVSRLRAGHGVRRAPLRTERLPGIPAIAGESGALYYFACRASRRTTHVAQWT